VRAEVHERTRRILPLPDGEEVEIALVRDRPWTAFNWYLGRGRSRIEFNTDLPFRSFMAADIMAHEGYPGHHTEWVLRETRQYRERGEGEWASAILGPQSVIAEGIASCARSVIFDGDEDLRWLSGDVLPALGQQLDPEQAGAVRRAADILEGASDNAAFLLHEDHLPVEEVKAYLMHWRLSTAEEAEKRLQFLLSPLWRVYTFTYTYGERLLAPLLAGPHRLRTFERILTEPVYPELLTRWVTEEP
jgi:hypothetical protein